MTLAHPPQLPENHTGAITRCTSRGIAMFRLLTAPFYLRPIYCADCGMYLRFGDARGLDRMDGRVIDTHDECPMDATRDEEGK